VTTGTELLSFSATGTDSGQGAYVFEYPTSGTLTWNTANNKYIQSWVPFAGEGDITAFQCQIDGDTTSTWQGNVFSTRIDGLETPFSNSRPGLYDLNTILGLSPGVHQLRFRFLLVNTQFAAEPGPETLDGDIDWIRAGMPPSSGPQPAACSFVGPADDSATTTTTPTLRWTAPDGFVPGTYDVTYSKDAHFRGPTTTTIHNIATNSYTFPTALQGGTWYWTVMAVNSDNIAGICLAKTVTQLWSIPGSYVFYSFKIPDPNATKHWPIYE
jgi:hypothetical protein